MVSAKVATVMRWYAQDDVNQEESEQNEVDAMKKGANSTGKVMQCLSERALVICNEEDTDGRAQGDSRWGAGAGSIVDWTEDFTLAGRLVRTL